MQRQEKATCLPQPKERAVTHSLKAPNAPHKQHCAEGSIGYETNEL